MAKPTVAEPQVIVEQRDGFAVISLDRPAAMNALSRELRRQLTGAFRSLERNPEVRVAILTGRGKAFSAGIDLKELSEEPEALAEMRSDENVVEAMAACSPPIIGAINGVAIKGASKSPSPATC